MLLSCLVGSAGATVSFRDISPDASTLYASGDAHGASGGRVNNLASVPGNNQIFYAASEWGGLWKTTDGGKVWIHLDAHVPAATWDVAVDPSNSQTVYATSLYDGRVNPRSGIEVSYDGGTTWTHPATAIPPPSFNCSSARRDEPSAFKIGIRPDAPQNVYIGTNCGVAITADSGATWTFVDPDAPNPASEIWSVVAQAGGPSGNGIVDACGAAGHFRSTDGGGTWQHHALPFALFNTGRCSLAVSPDEPDVIFVADDVNTRPTGIHSVWESDDGGQNWTELVGPRAYNSSPKRIPFVVTNKRSDSGGHKRFDLWYGEQDLWHTTCQTPTDPTGAGPRCSAVWTLVGATRIEDAGAHGDAGDLEFDRTAAVDACPVMFASDGGVYYRNPSDPDCQSPTFKQPDVSPHAIWLWGMAGANHPSDTVDLYMGLQDDGAWATTNAQDASPSWTDRLPSDSFSMVADTNRVVWFGDDDVTKLYVQAPGMTGAITSVATPNNESLIAFLFIPAVAQFGDKQYVVTTLVPSGSFPTHVYITNDITAGPVAWTQLGAATTPANICGVKVSVPPSDPTNPVFYVQAGGNCNRAFNDNTGDGLYKYAGTSPANAWQRIDTNDGMSGGIGIFDVDPGNPDRLYASNLAAAGPRMVFSTDGGLHWHQDGKLDQLMTGAGTFKYKNTLGPTNDYGFNATFLGYPQPSLVGFDPSDPNILVAGGRDSGLFITTNNAMNWHLLTDPIAPAVSGIPHISRPWFAHFQHDAASTLWLYIGTQGRGIWQIQIPSVDLSLVKSDGSPNPVAAGTDVGFTLTVANTSLTAAATDVVLNESTPLATTFQSIMSPPGWSCPTLPPVGGVGAIKCTKSLVPATETGVFTLTLHVPSNIPSGNVITNTASISSADPDPDLMNNAATGTADVITQADLMVAKTEKPPSVIPGNALTYTIVITNNGPSDAANVVLSDTVPTNTTFQHVFPATGWSCTTPPVGSGGTVTCTTTHLANGASATFLLSVRVNLSLNSDTKINNTVSVSSATADSTLSDDSSTAVAKAVVPVPMTGSFGLVMCMFGLLVLAVRTLCRRRGA
jgi:uncharacterized repeat protein (TIGR01451 family)